MRKINKILKDLYLLHLTAKVCLNAKHLIDFWPLSPDLKVVGGIIGKEQFVILF